MRATRRASLAVALWGAAGCYSDMPVERDTIVPGTQVRVEMTRLGFAALPQIPSQPGPRLAGTMVSTEASGMLLRVPVLIRQDGQVIGTVEQDLSVPFADVLAWERRAFNPARTGIAVAGVLGSVVGIYLAFGSGGPPTGEEPPPPPDEE